MLSPEIIKILLEILASVVTIAFTLPVLLPYEMLAAPIIWTVSNWLNLFENESKPKEFKSFFEKPVDAAEKIWPESCNLQHDEPEIPAPKR